MSVVFQSDVMFFILIMWTSELQIKPEFENSTVLVEIPKAEWKEFGSPMPEIEQILPFPMTLWVYIRTRDSPEIPILPLIRR